VKIRKFKYKQLLKLYLLKSRVYEQPIKKIKFNDLIDLNLDQILVGIKKTLHIIFQYHQTEKRILFIGLPYVLQSKINQSTRHIAVSTSFNIQGFISNNSSKIFKENKNLSQELVKKDSILLLPKLVKTPDLIILFDHDKSINILSEAWVAKVPVILFNHNNDPRGSLSHNFYIVKGNFKSILTTSDKNIFLVGLSFLFKNFRKNLVKSSSTSSIMKKQYSSSQKSKILN
jgi:hypothetical protein